MAASEVDHRRFFGLRSIRARILAVFVLSLAAFTGALGYGLVQLRYIGQGLAAINEGYLPLAEIAAELDVIVHQMDRDHDRFAREGTHPVAGHRSNAVFFSDSIADAVRRGQATADRALVVAHRVDDQAALRSIRRRMAEIDALRKDYDTAVTAWLAQTGRAGGEPGKALAQLEGKRTDLVLRTGQLSAFIEGRIHTVSAGTARARDRAYAVSGALAVLAIVLSGVLAWVALVTLRPIGELTAQVQRLAAGEAAGPVDLTSSDEVGVLAREFNAMAGAVAERDRRLSERAAALDRLSRQLRQVIDTIRAGLLVVEGTEVAMANPAAGRLWGVREQAPLPQALAGLRHGRHEATPIGDRRFNFDVVPFGSRGTLIVGEDVTERLRDRERLARSERLALVGQMLAQITHEVRNPLNAMSLNTELLDEVLAEGTAPPEAREMLGTIIDEVRRLEQVTARYLDLARRRRPELEAVEPGTVVREVLALEDEALRRAGVTVEIDAERMPVEELCADALRRSLRNLLRNAVEAGARSLKIAVRSTRLGEARAVEVAVRDDGPGMTPEQAARAFEPFFTTKARGTGLGLAISRQELEDAGGSLCCESAPGKGTTFRITLPLGMPVTEGGVGRAGAE